MSKAVELKGIGLKGVELIESIGSTAHFAEQQIMNVSLCSSASEQAMNNAALDSAVHQAILDKDKDNDKLNELLGVRNKIYCAMAAPKETDNDFDDELDEELLIAHSA